MCLKRMRKCSSFFSMFTLYGSSPSSLLLTLIILYIYALFATISQPFLMILNSTVAKKPFVVFRKVVKPFFILLLSSFFSFQILIFCVLKCNGNWNKFSFVQSIRLVFTLCLFAWMKSWKFTYIFILNCCSQHAYTGMCIRLFLLEYCDKK